MEIKQLKSFVTVSDCKSFSRAAQLLYISQPSISTHISMLEQEVGVRLIERTSKSVSLTDEGRDFYEYAVSILKINDKMLSEIGAKGLPCIHIGASTVPSAYILPNLLSEYTALSPESTFQIVQSDSRKVIDGVIEGIYDVGFVGSRCSEKGIESHIVAKDEMVFITPANEHYSKLLGDKDAIAKLLNEPFILREEGSGSGEMLKNLLSSLGTAEKNLRVSLRTNDHEAIINMVEKGMGVSLVSSLALIGSHERNVLQLKPGADAGVRDFYMIYKRSSLNRESVNGFISSVIKRR